MISNQQTAEQTAPGAKQTRRGAKFAAFILLGVAGLAIALLVAGVVLVQTAWFKNLIRLRIVSVVERVTGGHVEIGSFSYNWRNLTAEVNSFVLRGTEPASAPPMFRADKIQIGFRIISALEKKVDIASLIVESPHLYMTIGPDGSTNIPRPKIARFNENVVEDLLDLHVQHIELRQGTAEYNSWRFPLDATGEHLQMSLAYQIGPEPAGPRYLCAISSTLVRVSSPKLRAPAEFALNSQVELGRNTIQVLRMNLASGGMKIEARGNIVDLYSPNADFDVTAALPVQDLNRLVQTPLEPRGDLWFQGRATAGGSDPDRFVGKLTGRSLGYTQKGVEVRDIAVSSNADITPDKITLRDLNVSAPDGRFEGALALDEHKHVSVKGHIDGITVAEVGHLAHRATDSLSGTLSGPLQLDGQVTPSGLAGVNASAVLDLKPGQAGVPLRGSLALNYDHRSGQLQLGNSQIDIGATHADISGTLGDDVTLHVVSKNLDDATPLLRVLGAQPPAHWPVELDGGVARIDASIRGGLDNPKISGKADAENLKLAGQQLDRVASTFTLDQSSAVLQAITIDEGKMHLEGNGRAGLRNWKLEESSPVSAIVSLRAADIQALAAEAGWKPLPATGLISAAVHVSGSLESPLVAGVVTLDNLTAYGEHFAEARADLTYTATAIEVSHGEARNGAERITLSGDYNHPARDWKDGSLRFDVASSGVDLATIQHLQDIATGLGGRLNLKASGGAKIVDGVVDLTSLNGELTVRNAALDGHTYGSLTVTAATKLPLLTLAATATLDDVQIHGSGEWRMEGDYRGEARVPIPRLTFATLHDLMPGKHLRKDLPFGGFVEGEAVISGPLNQLSSMKADVTLSTVQLNASPNAKPVAGTVLQDLILHNAQPVHIVATANSIDFGHTSFIAKDTTLDASGRLTLNSKTLNSKSPLDVAIQGRINFSILQLFNPDLLGAGASIINVTVRGPLTEPQVNGRLELQNASLFLRDVPNGVDNANGLILFDSNRATVQNLSGKSGGGDISFESGSFLGFRGAALVYRLQATARNVRYRSDDGVSLTADGSLALVGTSDSSVLSGSVSLTRAVFNPRTDVGALLASTTTPVAAAPNEYLQGLQLDVRVVTQHTLEVETALSRNIQADADLRVRGTPDRPILLGQITVNSGQIEFFGNKYSINRGDITFNNPAKIEPVLNMDLSTKVRGITVDIIFSGPLNKLNFSYRSDPPLEASDIIALLAVGRTPSTLGPLATSQATTNINNSYLGLGTGTDSLLSQAISPNSGRLQKLFGVSHIKIDPQLSDVTIVPQARLTLEQQVSSDVTLTYIQNLAVSDQQIVRVEWDFSRKWSAVALRDENGAFSIDFEYRKRFK